MDDSGQASIKSVGEHVRMCWVMPRTKWYREGAREGT